MAYLVDRYEPRGSHSKATYFVDRVVAVCGIFPYSLIAIGLRLLAARGLFLFGQTQVEGSTVPFSLNGVDFTVVVPSQIRADVLQSITTQFSSLAVSPTLIAYFFGYGAFILPICLVIGFGTRIASLLLLAMTVLLAMYVQPAALWTIYAYWGVMLLVLMTCGPGPVSLDGIIRFFYRQTGTAYREADVALA